MAARWKFLAVVCLSMAASYAQATTTTSQKTVREVGEPIMAIISIASQKVSWYDANGRIYQAPVSTGVRGRETPAGVFTILEKNKEHRSNLYDDASMPNMQRITWNGLAMHGGPLPGYPASHGCIRMPYRFAGKVFSKTRLGMRVIVSPHDAAPVDISHPTLFSPNPEDIAAAPVRKNALADQAKEAVKGLKEAKKASKSAARQVVLQKKLLRKLKKSKKKAEASLKRSIKRLATANKTKKSAEERHKKATVDASTLAEQFDDATKELVAKVAAVNAALAADQTGDEAKQALKDAQRESALAKALVGKQEQQKKKVDSKLVRAEKAVTDAEAARVKAEARQQKAAAKASELATQIEAETLSLEEMIAAAATAKKAVKTAKRTKSETAIAARDAKLALQPVSVYISRATEKLYVRRNTHKPARDGGGKEYDSSIKVPVAIRDPGMPIGTHIFTAMELEDGGLRWSVVTIDGEDPKGALDRITIPQEVLARIAPTALPRSSIIISDEPLSKETNYRTEFVAVLSHQPKGGFKTRLPSKKRDSQDSETQLKKKLRKRRSFRFAY